jgi:hypothetical protein
MERNKMPFFKVRMTQVIEHEYNIEAADEVEATLLAYKEDAKDVGHWYNDGNDAEIATTVHEMSPEEIETANKWERAVSQLRHHFKDEDKKNGDESSP